MKRELEIGFGVANGSIKEQVEEQGFEISEMAGQKFDDCRATAQKERHWRH